jgi:hypothetical protein
VFERGSVVPYKVENVGLGVPVVVTPKLIVKLLDVAVPLTNVGTPGAGDGATLLPPPDIVLNRTTALLTAPATFEATV